jgi:hypothetical protein
MTSGAGASGESEEKSEKSEKSEKVGDDVPVRFFISEVYDQTFKDLVSKKVSIFNFDNENEFG